MYKGFIQKNIFLIFLTVYGAYSQNDSSELFRVDTIVVTIGEFEKVYTKNLNLVEELSDNSVEEYLDLYINFKLKVAEAYSLKMDESPSYKKELASSKEQLSKPYLVNSEITEALIKEVYDRTVKEVNASHILIKLAPNASVKDTIKAFKKIQDIRSKAVNGLDFETLAKKYSQDPSAVSNGGNLGYFKAFSMVYAFENAAYNTKQGEISLPFRSKFGYHILKVNDFRKGRGEVEVAHIVIKGDKEKHQQKIKEIHLQLDNGASFASLATKFSEDKQSANRGGRLPRFSSGMMVEKFEDIAFSINKPGEYSEPFKTSYGYHIVQLLRKFPLASFEEMYPALKKKINGKERTRIAGNQLGDSLKQVFKVTVNQKLLRDFLAHPEKNKEYAQKILLSIEGQNYPVSSFVFYCRKSKEEISLISFERYQNSRILQYYKDNLEAYNKDYAHTVLEYKEGLLLFDLLKDKVWDAAEKDSTGLKNFFLNNISSYQSKAKVAAIFASAKSKVTIEKVKKRVEQGVAITKIKEEFNTGNTIQVQFNEGIMDANAPFLVPFTLEKGISSILLNKDFYEFVYVKETYPSKEPILEEVRGIVLSDYQKKVEENWLEELKKKYAIKINKSSLERVKKEVEN